VHPGHPRRYLHVDPASGGFRFELEGTHPPTPGREAWVWPRARRWLIRRIRLGAAGSCLTSWARVQINEADDD
jgi:hypothetical protein